jgi:hypothetical protein
MSLGRLVLDSSGFPFLDPDEQYARPNQTNDYNAPQHIVGIGVDHDVARAVVTNHWVTWRNFAIKLLGSSRRHWPERSGDKT